MRAADRERLPRTPFIPAQAGIHDFVSRASEARPGTPTPDLRPWVPAFAGTNGGESLGKHVRAGLRWTVGTRFATGRSPCGAHPRRRFGRIAQLVEQLTLNQRVPGSSPGAPTKFPQNDNELALEAVRPKVARRLSPHRIRRKPAGAFCRALARGMAPAPGGALPGPRWGLAALIPRACQSRCRLRSLCRSRRQCARPSRAHAARACAPAGAPNAAGAAASGKRPPVRSMPRSARSRDEKFFPMTNSAKRRAAVAPPPIVHSERAVIPALLALAGTDLA